MTSDLWLTWALTAKLKISAERHPCGVVCFAPIRSCLYSDVCLRRSQERPGVLRASFLTDRRVVPQVLNICTPEDHNGLDYMAAFFHCWLQEPGRVVFIARIGGRVVRREGEPRGSRPQFSFHGSFSTLSCILHLPAGGAGVGAPGGRRSDGNTSGAQGGVRSEGQRHRRRHPDACDQLRPPLLPRSLCCEAEPRRQSFSADARQVQAHHKGGVSQSAGL